jgi:hypothetical protein
MGGRDCRCDRLAHEKHVSDYFFRYGFSVGTVFLQGVILMGINS